MDKQSFNLNADFLGGYTGIFIKIVIAIIIVYAFIMLINFFRDKFLQKERISDEPQITDLLHILYKLSYLTGFGFIIANILQVFLNELSNARNPIQFKGDWGYLTFGVILIFIGIGFKKAKK